MGSLLYSAVAFYTTCLVDSSLEREGFKRVRKGVFV